nr:hypothetical protein Iba_chr07bCG0960 [Ipomoea batatas]
MSRNGSNFFGKYFIHCTILGIANNVSQERFAGPNPEGPHLGEGLNSELQKLALHFRVQLTRLEGLVVVLAPLAAQSLLEDEQAVPSVNFGHLESRVAAPAFCVDHSELHEKDAFDSVAWKDVLGWQNGAEAYQEVLVCWPVSLPPERAPAREISGLFYLCVDDDPTKPDSVSELLPQFPIFPLFLEGCNGR